MPSPPFPSGSIFMLDEGVTGPAAAFSRTTGAPLGIDNTVDNCEVGAILPNGVFAINALDPGNLANSIAVKIYDPTFTLLAQVPVTAHSGSHPICGNNLDRFYACSGPFGNTLTAYSQAGSVLGTWTIGSGLISGVLVDSGNLVAYFSQVVSGAYHIRRFDLVNNVALSDLVTFASTVTVTAHGWGITAAGDLLVVALDNGDTTGNVFRYSTAGSLLATYALDANPTDGGQDVLLALDFFDPTTFWYRVDPDPTGDTCIFRQIRLSDGTQLQSFTENMNGTDFQVSGYAPASCPFLILWSGSTPPPPIPPPCAQPSNPLLGCAGDLPLPGASGGTGCAGDVASPGV